MPIIQLKNLRKVFKNGQSELVVLKSLSLDIPQSQFLSITGRSGSGKSTLLYQMGLLDRPTSGEVIINEQETSRLSTADRTRLRLHRLGYIFQDYALLPMLTAIENVCMPLLMQGKKEGDAQTAALSALEKVGLAQKVSNLPSQLSGGEQQRVSIARAIVHEPTIIFADEPTANLDSESSEMILDVFVQLNRSGQTIVMVTHEKEYAQRAHRIITLSDGTIIADQQGKK